MNAHRKGSRWQREVRRALEAAGHSVTVRGLGTPGDDLRVPGLRLSVEAKNHRAFTPAAWIDQAQANAPTGWLPVVWAHRRNHTSAADGYVLLTGRDFLALLTEDRP